MNVGSGGGAAAAAGPSAGGAAAGGDAPAAAEEEKKEEGMYFHLRTQEGCTKIFTEKEESDEDMGFGLFD